MLSTTCWKAYRERYGRGSCYFDMPDRRMIVYVDGAAFAEPVGEQRETDDQFMDRMRRSEKAERNLFAEEWPRYGNTKAFEDAHPYVVY